MLEIVLTPSNRTVESVEASGDPETVTLTDGTPSDERMAFFISSALSILFPLNIVEKDLHMGLDSCRFPVTSAFTCL